MDIKSILPMAEQGFETEKTEKYINYLQEEYEKIRLKCIELSDKLETLTADIIRLKEENGALKAQLKTCDSSDGKTDFPPSISTVNELFISRMLMDLLENSEKTRINASEQIRRSINDLRLNFE